MPGARNFCRIAANDVAFEAHDRNALYDASHVMIGQELRKCELKEFNSPLIFNPGREPLNKVLKLIDLPAQA